MTKMGTLGGPWSQAYAVNNKTKSRVWRIPRMDRRNAFLATNGVLKDLGTISGPNEYNVGLRD